MPIYKYKARNRQGKEIAGELEAVNEAAVRNELRRQAAVPISIKKKPKEIQINIPGFKQKVKMQDIVVFTRQFSTMIDAGLPIVQILDILGEQTENPVLANAVKEVKSSVESGSTYADGLRKFPQIFDDIYIHMVEAGETGGILDTILNRLSIYIERAMNLRKKVKSAASYPIVITFIAVIIVSGLLIFIIPQFASLFTSFGGTLPLPTLIVIKMSDFLAGWGGGMILISSIALFLFVKRAYKTQKGRLAIDKLLLKLPVFGDILQKVAVAKFTRTLGTLISSGVPILDSLTITAKTSGNKVIENAIYVTKNDIAEGKTIAEPLRDTKVFPPMVVQMISVGETTGALDNMLSKIADFYDDEVDAAVETLTSLLEPMLMVFLGITIGFIVIAMYLPIFKLATLVG
ncbi:MAG: type II secretion system F family protein [bacterium]